jgi:outer membrane protein TolC
VEDSISKALQKNLDIKIKSVDKSIGEDLRRQAVGAFNPSFKFEGSRDDIKRPQNTQDFQATGGTAANLASREPRIFEERNYHGKASIEGKLPIGTKYEVYSKLDILKNTLNTTSPLSLYNPEEWQTFTGIDVTQPLLKGFGTDVNLAELRVARTNKQISEEEFRSQMLEVVATALQTYYDLTYLAQDLRLKQEEYKLSTRLTEEKKRLFEKGKVSPRDVNRAEAALAQTIEEVTQSQNKLIEKQTQFLALISEVDPLGKPFLIQPTSAMPDEAPFLDTAALIREAFLKRPEYITAKYKVERENIKLIYAHNQIWPQLDFKTTAGYNGLSYGYSKSMKNAFSGSASQWSLGFVFSVPIGNDTAIGAKNEAIHRKENALMTLQQVENNTTLGVQQFVAIIKSNIKRYDAMTLFRRNAERAEEEEEIRLEKGLSTELDLLKFKRDLTDARTREFAARADVNKVLVRLYQLNGTLLDRQKISVVE